MTLSELYGALTQQPILHDGSILSVIEGRELSFQLSFKHQDHLAKKKQTSIESISLNPDIFNPFNLERLDFKESGDTLFECVKPEALYLWTAPTILNDCVQETSISPSGTLRALFMSAEQEDCKSKKLTWIELWQKNYRVAIIRTTDTYSDLYHDSSIGSFSWNKAETKLAFIAAPSLAKKSDTELDPQEYQDKYEHFSSYGENYIDLRPPCIFIADFRKCSVSPIQLDVDPLQVIFASSSGDILMAKDEDILSSDEALYLVGLDVRRFPRRPGIFACPNRPTQIYRYQASKFVKIVTTGFESIPKIRMNGPDTTQIFFLSGKSGGPHRAGHKLVKYDIMSGECSVIVDLVEEPNFEKGEFPGLYLFGMEFPRNPFLLQKDSTWMVMSSIWGFRITTLLINTETKEIIHLTPNPAFCSWTVLDVKDGYILAVYESFITLPKPMIGKVDLSYITASKSNSINIATESNSLAIKWRSLDRRKPGLFGFVDDHIGVFDWLAMNTEIEPHWHQGETDSFESLLLYPRNYLPFEPSRRITVSSSVESKMALIVSPHGGPHSTFTHKWETRVAGYLAMGHAVLLGKL